MLTFPQHLWHRGLFHRQILPQSHQRHTVARYNYYGTRIRVPVNSDGARKIYTDIDNVRAAVFSKGDDDGFMDVLIGPERAGIRFKKKFSKGGLVRSGKPKIATKGWR